MIITGLTKHMVAAVGNIVEGIINVDYKVIVEIYFGAIIKRSAIFIRSQITS